MAQKLYGAVGTPETSTPDNPSPATREQGNFDRPGFVRGMYRRIMNRRKKKLMKKQGTYSEMGAGVGSAIKERAQRVEREKNAM